LLCRFVVFLKLVLDMTIGAINPKRGLEGEHDLRQSLRGDAPEQLDVLVLLFGSLFLAAGDEGIE
jgi:hypothetical protein